MAAVRLSGRAFRSYSTQPTDCWFQTEEVSMNIAVTLGLLIFGVLVCVVARSEEPPEVILASLPPRITMTAAGMIAPRLLMEHATIRLDIVFACASAAA